MTYTSDELQTIEDMAALFYSYKDIAIVLEVDVEEFKALMRLEEGNAYSRYQKGWITSDMSIRKSLLESAVNGSSPAQMMLMELNKENKNG
jgi:hypothetical protein